MPYIPFYIVKVQVSTYILSLACFSATPYLENCERVRQEWRGNVTRNWNVWYFDRLKTIWYYCSWKNGIITFREQVTGIQLKAKETFIVQKFLKSTNYQNL